MDSSASSVDPMAPIFMKVTHEIITPGTVYFELWSTKVFGVHFRVSVARNKCKCRTSKYKCLYMDKWHIEHTDWHTKCGMMMCDIMRLQNDELFLSRLEYILGQNAMPSAPHSPNLAMWSPQQCSLIQPFSRAQLDFGDGTANQQKHHINGFMTCPPHPHIQPFPKNSDACWGSHQRLVTCQDSAICNQRLVMRIPKGSQCRYLKDTMAAKLCTKRPASSHTWMNVILILS